jgi:hypothetical protein
VIAALASALTFAAAPACTTLGKALVEHSCIHAKSGPFGDGIQPQPLPASVAPTFSAPTPNVNKAHTQFAIALPPDGEGAVKYVPSRGGEWAFFRSAAAPFKVLDANGQPIAFSLEHDVADCAELPRLSVATLTANASYFLVLGPSAATPIGVVVEKVSDFVLFYYPDDDGDGFGRAIGELETACTPPAGYVENDADCDDRNAAVKPGAVELCNGVDDDCDGKVDEQCVAGAGDAAASSQDGGVTPDAQGSTDKTGGGCALAGRSTRGLGASWLILPLGLPHLSRRIGTRRRTTTTRALQLYNRGNIFRTRRR